MILPVINNFLHHPVVMVTLGALNKGVFSGLIRIKEKSMEARLQLPLDGMAKRQCLTTGINFLVICMACQLHQVNQT